MTEANPAMAVMGLSTAYWASRCLHVVAELGVADVLGDQPQAAEALAAALGLRAQPLGRVLRCLANHGIFEMREGAFAHNAASRLLRSDGRPSLRSFARMMGLKPHWAAYGELEEALRTGEPPIAKAVGGSFFDYMAAHPQAAAVFDEAMAGKSAGQIRSTLAAYDFTPFGTIGDIGGGAGHLLEAVLDAAPEAQGVLFDLPQVVARASAGPNPRIRYVGGDFFKDPIPACDAYLMMTVLHDWSDEEAARILSAVRKAAPAHAKLLLIENVIGGRAGDFDFGADLDIEMLVMTTGRERTEQEWGQLLDAGGWRLARLIPTGGLSSFLIEGEIA